MSDSAPGPEPADLSRPIDVSVIVPLHDRATLVPMTLDSLDPGHHPGVRLEVIVVDDGSTDGGGAMIARRFPDVGVVRQPHSGAPTARNHGLRLSRSPFVLLLDSDDLIEPGFFGPRLDALQAWPEAAGAYGPWEHFRGNAAPADSLVVPRHTTYPLEQTPQGTSHLRRLLGGWYIPPHAIVWRRETLLRLGGQNESLLINQDVDLVFRVLCGGHTLVGTSGPRAWYRDHGGPRQGQAKSRQQAKQLLTLREAFVDALRAADRLGPQERTALATYCFHRWRELRREHPDIADRLLALSQQLEPRFRLEGRVALRLLSVLVGPARATILRDWLRGTP